ncbi:MAG: tripartite tricarboxylate transporter substrate binding protein [Burkholderiales bacterium]
MRFTTPATLTAALALVFIGSALAQDYPSRPLRLIAPFPPGGGIDFLARILGQKMTESWGQQVVIDNRSGGSGIIGMEIAARAAPDGYTILMSEVGTLSINPSVFSRLSYDPLRDFQPVTKVGDIPLTCAVHPSLRITTLQDFVAAAKAKPGELRFASAGNGSMLHLATELFAKRAGIKLTHVPYKGGSLGLNALLSNEVNLLCMTTSSLLPHVQQGRINALAISTAQRSQSLPDLRTIAEQGYAGYDTAQWVGMLVPKATPKSIVTKLHAESVRILALPDVRDRLKTAGVEAVGNTPDAFAAQIRADTEKYGKLASELGIRLD